MAMTMLQMSGVAPVPATMADGILLIIDAQREYTDGLLPLPGVGPAVDALAVLLEKARVAGAPVVHVRHQSKGKAFNPDSTGYEIVKVLITDIIPDQGVKDAMNRINEMTRLAVANKAQGDAEYVLKVRQAEADAEVMHQAGLGIALERKAIADGLSDAIDKIAEGMRRFPAFPAPAAAPQPLVSDREVKPA